MLKKLLTVLTAGFLMLHSGFTAFAEVPLPDGSVKGLPEKLMVMDSDGNSVSSDTGEYFFHVEDMAYGETYTKDIQVMNLRSDKAYHIYFYVEPLSKDGEIDLENGCDCKMYLDGKEVFSGNVNGIGNIDLTENPLDLGSYQPGESHTLSCSVSWNDMNVDKNSDYGKRLVTKDGTTILVEPNVDGTAYGEINYKWIFYAVVDEDYNPPYTGLLSGSGKIWLACMGVVFILILGLLFLMYRRKKENKSEKA